MEIRPFVASHVKEFVRLVDPIRAFNHYEVKDYVQSHFKHDVRRQVTDALRHLHDDGKITVVGTMNKHNITGGRPVNLYLVCP